MQKPDIKKFQTTVWDFYKKNKRNFPWREPIRRGSGQAYDPYKILVSEIMLQQTQADRVVRYYGRWLEKFPDAHSLARVTFAEIYPFWQGLGYNRRALALQKAAKKVIDEFNGKFPSDVGRLEEFPGIGPYTARAVSIFSFNTPVACIETNIRRVFIHHFFTDKENIEDKEILELAERALPMGNAREWHWALMDYGAYLKTQVLNPNRRHKNYSVQSKFEGSLRQIRGNALRILSTGLMDKKELTERLTKITLQTGERVEKVLAALEKEGLVKQNRKQYSLK
ncbi:A/G-specific adenine glycosylase [Candidatus Parcubacteria bacterium]|nr:A/G-specific adenine glycosylase [Candidatus Parcubacteria bacterium]